MGWLDKVDEANAKKIELLRRMIAREIDSATLEQLTIAIVIMRKIRAKDPAALALIEPPLAGQRP